MCKSTDVLFLYYENYSPNLKVLDAIARLPAATSKKAGCHGDFDACTRVDQYAGTFRTTVKPMTLPYKAMLKVRLSLGYAYQ